VIRKPRSVMDASALPLARLVPIPQAKPILLMIPIPRGHLALPRQKAARIEPISSSRRPPASLTVVSSAAAQESAKPQGLAIFSPFHPAALMQESGVTRPRRCPGAPARSGMGHEDAFPRPRLSARYRFSQGTFAGTRGNGPEAPIPDLRSVVIEHRESVVNNLALATRLGISITAISAVIAGKLTLL